MPILFVSHASKDDRHADPLQAWLCANGFNDLFVDHHNIDAGDKWAEALQASAGACRVVLCLVTENWLASSECFSEFKAAWYMGKRIIPLFLLPPKGNLSEEAEKRLANVCAQDQGVELNACIGPDGILKLEADPKAANRLASGLRAAGALTDVGLDPTAFTVNRKLRPTPFPGLASFNDDDADAAIFYGRSGEIAQTLEELRKMRAERDQRPLVIFGASGAGKSSLLKAGIIPRLRRETPAWLPLRAFRPGADPLLNFAEAISKTLADFSGQEAHGIIRDKLFDAWSRAERGTSKELTESGLKGLERELETLGNKLRETANRKSASILVSIDQAEEMTRAEGDSAEALADYLRVALSTSEGSWQLAFTIRTDSFPELQRHRRFQNLKARGYDLRAVPTYRFERVVEEPAKRYGVAVESTLVDALMEDAPESDALPLLAFALQRLWHQFMASGVLSKDNYDKIGRLKGLIEDAAERALRGIEPEQDVPLSSRSLSQRQIDLASSAFVPSLAQINEYGVTIRRAEIWTEFGDEQQQLLNRFERWRLVVLKGKEPDSCTVEIVHEALFREWTRLKLWLEPERARLEALRSLQITATTWDRHDRTPAFLDHRGERLQEATKLSEIGRYRKRMGNLEFKYLKACQEAESAAISRKRQVRALVGLLAVVIVAGLIAWLNEPYLRERINWYTTMRPYMLKQVRPYVLTPEVESGMKPGNTFQECAKNCPVMVVIPAGEFMMGSPESRKGDRDGPQHKITIAKSFAVGKFEVTFDEWDACVEVGGCKRDACDAVGRCEPIAGGQTWGRGRRPVINVSWNDAKQFVDWFSKMTGKEYRLLSEAEWEYAARAGSTTAYSWGNEIKKDGKTMANCGNCGSQYQRQTAPVGQFDTNAFGLYDMHGNVNEWVEDCAHDSYEGAPENGSVWMSDTCIAYMYRGGSWYADHTISRSAWRDWLRPNYRSSSVGFRVARTLNQ
jgi:formylglycine-generating enzyme required for sulfatase activity